MRKVLLLISPVLILIGCAYTVDTSVQDLTVHTPGAENSVCYVYVDDVKYRLHPPQTTSIFRSKEDLIVDCLAPGNRRKKVIIEPTYNDSAYGNVATAGAGLAWDYASGALYRYPDVVEVNFVDVPIGPALIPAQNKSDIRQPEDYRLEEFRPSQPRMNADKDQMPAEFLKRGELSNISAVSEAAMETQAFTESEGAMDGKGQLEAVVETYADEESADSAPTPIIPGE